MFLLEYAATFRKKEKKALSKFRNITFLADTEDQRQNIVVDNVCVLEMSHVGCHPGPPPCCATEGVGESSIAGNYKQNI